MMAYTVYLPGLNLKPGRGFRGAGSSPAREIDSETCDGVISGVLNPGSSSAGRESESCSRSIVSRSGVKDAGSCGATSWCRVLPAGNLKPSSQTEWSWEGSVGSMSVVTGGIVPAAGSFFEG